MEIIESKENALLKRTEVRFKVENAGATPSRKEVKEALCAKLGVDAKLVVIDKLDQGYGRAETLGKAHVYKDEKSAKIEREYLVKRDSKEKGEKKEEAPAPAKEEKKEVKKEEPKEEKKE